MKDVATMKVELKKLIDTAAGRVPADLVIKNCKIVNVFSGKIQEGDIAFSGNQIAGIGEYEGVKVIDAEGRYAAPGYRQPHPYRIFLCKSRGDWTSVSSTWRNNNYGRPT